MIRAKEGGAMAKGKGRKTRKEVRKSKKEKAE
jgi:hypothetical protein